MRPSRLLLLAGLLLAACRDEPAVPKPFKPSADGRLTKEQVRAYLADPKGMRPAERQWVAARVREARTAALTGGMDLKIAEGRRRILRSLEERRRTLNDPAEQARLDRQIAEVRRLLLGAPPEVPSVVRENAELVARMER